MNSLSWMIYLAGVTGSMSTVLTLGALATGGASGACAIIWASTGETPTIWSWEDKETKVKAHAAYRAKIAGFIKPLICACGVFAAIAAIIPSSGTIYAIAASETGEDVLKSDTGGKAVKALNAWLDKQIAGEPEKGE